MLITEHIPTLALIGLRASGKSTVGALVAASVGRPFIDLDQRTLSLLGAPTVAHAWRDAGEHAFRAAEARALADALRLGSAVLALGGGTPTAPGAADALRAARARNAARVIYLHAEPEALRARLAASPGDRPSLTGKGTLEEIYDLSAARDPLYRSLADLVLDASRPAQDNADAIASFARSLR